MAKSLMDIYKQMYAPKPVEIREEKEVENPLEDEDKEKSCLTEEPKVDKDDIKKVEKELEKIVSKIDEEQVPVTEAKKNISVWSHDGKVWSHYSDYDDEQDAKDDKRYLKDQGDKKVKIIKTDKDKSDWRNSKHREDAVKLLEESCPDDADDSSIKVDESRSEADANRSLEMSQGYGGSPRRKGKFYLMKGMDQVHPDAHDSVDSAMKAWKDLPEKSGVKIIKESKNGPVEIMTEAALMEAFDVDQVGIVGSPSTMKLYGKTYTTVAFPSVEHANAFMTSDEGKEHGYLGQDDEGMFHCAHMEHTGSDE